MAALRHLLLSVLLAAAAVSAGAASPRPHNLLIFVADGLRYGSVTPETAPNMAAIRAEGVDFRNSHSLFPTVTTANASAIATGHGLGDTGNFGNTLFPGAPPLPGSAPGVFAGMENDRTLSDMNARFGGDYLDETTLIEAARKAGYSTAVIGKVGPASIQDVVARDGRSTVVVDDATGRDASVPLAPEIRDAIRAAGLADAPPPSRTPNSAQQDWFTAVAAKVLLPRFKAADRPFAMVFWSRDPDGSQHYNEDSLGRLVPGINGPTALAGIRNADADLGRLRAALAELKLDRTTDIVVVADHGFSTVSRRSRTSWAARQSYADVPAGQLPPGFLAIDLSHKLGLSVGDPRGQPLAPGQHTRGGSSVLGADLARPDVMIGANGGAVLIWLRDPGDRRLARRIVGGLMAEDYTAAVFVDGRLGPVPGALPLRAVGLDGAARTPRPQIAVSLRSFSTGCARAELCAAEVAETELQQGQGIHGSLSRANTHNFMAAHGPDFRSGYVDPAPVSNADLAPTLARILGLSLGGTGGLHGRVIEEALKSGGAAPAFARHVSVSAPTAGGFQTVLNWQSVGAERYYDSAGAYGRVVR
jgi:arylsulfatase A-like enzyme